MCAFTPAGHSCCALAPTWMSRPPRPNVLPKPSVKLCPVSLLHNSILSHILLAIRGFLWLPICYIVISTENVRLAGETRTTFSKGEIMKRSTALVAAAVGILVVGAYWIGQNQNQAQAQGRDKKEVDKRLLTTSGTATIRIKPDSARVFFTVETYGEQIREARTDNAQKTRKILDAIKALKIPNLKTKSDNVIVDLVRSQDRTPTTLPKLLGYHITNSFTVLVENEDTVKLGDYAARILDTGVENGA